jgi:hypothetical protein
MHRPLPASARIAALQAEIRELEARAITELKEKRVALAQQLHDLDCEIARLTGKPAAVPGRRKRAALVGRAPSLQELTDLLSAVPGHRLNLRKEGLDAKHVKRLAAANPALLKMGGKGAWPEVFLAK